MASHAALILAVPIILGVLLLPHFPVIKALLVSILTYWFTLGSSVGLYRVSPWHPLARFPGPIALRLTKLSLASISRGGRRNVYTQQLHQRYGDIVRIGELYHR